MPSALRFVFLVLSAKLSAGGVYVSAERAADGRANAVVLKRFCKLLYSLLARGGKLGLGYGIDGNEVDVYGEAVAL